MWCGCFWVCLSVLRASGLAGALVHAVAGPGVRFARLLLGGMHGAGRWEARFRRGGRAPCGGLRKGGAGLAVQCAAQGESVRQTAGAQTWRPAVTGEPSAGTGDWRHLNLNLAMTHAVACVVLSSSGCRMGGGGHATTAAARRSACAESWGVSSPLVAARERYAEPSDAAATRRTRTSQTSSS